MAGARWLLSDTGARLHYPAKPPPGYCLPYGATVVAACDGGMELYESRTDDHEMFGIKHVRCARCLKLGLR